MTTDTLRDALASDWRGDPRGLRSEGEVSQACKHMNFDCVCRVARIEDIGRFVLEVTVRCTECDTPFQFIGVQPGFTWEGCTRVSEAKNGGGGCDNCYAEAMNRWLRKGENWGPGAPPDPPPGSDAHLERALRRAT